MLSDTLTVARPEIEPWLPLIHGKCREVARRFRGYVERDDLVSEVAIWWFSSPESTLTAYVADERPLRLSKAVWRVAYGAAKRARDAYGPDRPFVQERYAPRQVLELIPIALDPEGLPDGGGFSEGPKPKGNLAESGDLLAALVDVRRALHALPVEDRDALVLVDQLRWDMDRAAAAFGIEPDSARRRIARIAQRLANWLNRDDDELPSQVD